MRGDGSLEHSFSVSYDPSLNQHLAGNGRLAVREDAASGGRLYVFTGRTRRPFSRAELTLNLTADRIRNVEQQGPRVRFTADFMEKTRLHPHVFAFTCEREEDAAAIAALLPTTIDPSLLAERQFADRLSRLPQARHAWTSLTGLIVLANVAVFLVMAGFFGAGWFDANLEPYVRLGANNGGVTTDGEWWRLVTSMFMHFGVLHLALNMWALFDAGRLLERLAGAASFALLYFGSGIGGSLASILWNGDRVWSAGASGAVFGVYGALLGYALREKGSLPPTIFKPFFRSSLWFVGYNLAYGFALAGIDNAAHIGGLLTGFALGWLTALPLEWERRRPLFRRRFATGLLVATLLITAGVAAAPRFDYRVRDRIALEEVLKQFGPREEQLLRRRAPALERYLKNRDNAGGFAEWLERDYLPFYRDFSDRLAALDLATDRSTAKRRDALRRFTEARAEGGRQLIAALRDGDPEALKAYEAAESAATDVLHTLRPEH